MIIVAGEIRTQPGTRSAFMEAVASMVAATLTEPGCRTYAFTPDPDDDDLIRLFELWDDGDALAAHFASAHMADWQQRSRSLAVAGVSINKYLISSVEPL